MKTLVSAAATLAILGGSTAIIAATTADAAPSLVQRCESAQRSAMQADLDGQPEPAASPDCTRLTDAQWDKIGADLDGLHTHWTDAMFKPASAALPPSTPDAWVQGQYDRAAASQAHSTPPTAEPDQWVADQYAHAAATSTPDAWIQGQIDAAAAETP